MRRPPVIKYEITANKSEFPNKEEYKQYMKRFKKDKPNYFMIVLPLFTALIWLLIILITS